MPIGKVTLCSLCLRLTPGERAILLRLQAAEDRQSAQELQHAAAQAGAERFYTADDLWGI